MSDTVEEFLFRRTPTAARPLLGLTVLLVEDSRFASEAMRLLCLRSGARLRRADTLRAARRHLGAYKPSVVIVDLGLPDGSGADLIAELAAADPHTALIATSGDDDAADRAVAAGAKGFLAKPVESLGVFQQVVLSLLPEDAQPQGPRVLSAETVSPEPLALQDDLAHAAHLLGDGPDAATLGYIAQFLSGVARTAADSSLADAAGALAEAPEPSRAAVTARLQRLLGQRMDAAAVV